MDLEINLYNDKMLKKDSSRFGFGVLIYSILMLVIGILGVVVRAVHYHFVLNTELTDQVFDKITNEMTSSGIESITAVIIGMVFLKWFFKNIKLENKIFYENNLMDLKRFLGTIFVFMSIQYIFGIFSSLGEGMLNIFGYSMMGDIEMATSYSTTISMFMYASIIGPISEELIFRGFILRGLEKYGKNLAVIVSAIMFGAFHGNFIQGLFAFVVGLVLGYVAINYSIKWSIVLHVINNFVFGDLMGHITKNLNESTQTMIWGGIYTMFLIGSIWVLLNKRKEIGNYICENRSKGYLKAFSSIGMILFFVSMILLAISSIEKI